MPTFYQDHESLGKITIIFIQTFIQTLVILWVNKHFWGKFCVSLLFNNCFPISIKVPVKYNTVLLVVNKVAKIPWFCTHKLKKHWKATANVFQKYLENFVSQLFIILQLPLKFAVFLKSSLLFNSFYCLFFL